MCTLGRAALDQHVMAYVFIFFFTKIFQGDRWDVEGAVDAGVVVAEEDVNSLRLLLYLVL